MWTTNIAAMAIAIVLKQPLIVLRIVLSPTMPDVPEALVQMPPKRLPAMIPQNVFAATVFAMVMRALLAVPQIVVSLFYIIL